jgi:glutamate/aspartate transport system substrate-binding protein
MISKFTGAVVSIAFALVASQATAQPLTGTLKKIADAGAITLSVRDNQLPFSYIDDSQKVMGYSLDLCHQVVDAVKKVIGAKDVQVKTQLVTAQTRIPLLANGTVDLDCSSVTNNAARQTQVGFSSTTFLAATSFAYKKGSGLKTIADLKDKAVVSIAGTNNIVQLNEVNTKRNLGMRILSAKTMAEAFLMLSTDRAVALVTDDILLASFIAASSEPSAYAISAEPFGPVEPYALVMRRDDPEFKRVVDKALADFFATPAAKQTYAKWFQAPIPPKGINLNFPMSSGLSKAYAKPTDSIDAASY